jgi:REP element-mobilizing transposase RayT
VGIHNTSNNNIIMSYTTSYYHIVIRTYRSELTINEEHERELYAYIYGIAKNLNCQTYRIGGMPDHLHIFVSLPSYLSLASFVQRVKTDSSKWLKANPNFPHFQGWGREYAGFSYSLRDKDMIVNYIMKQKEHHHKTTFPKEYRTFLQKNGTVIDERYFLRDE